MSKERILTELIEECESLSRLKYSDILDNMYNFSGNLNPINIISSYNGIVKSVSSKRWDSTGRLVKLLYPYHVNTYNNFVSFLGELEKKINLTSDVYREIDDELRKIGISFNDKFAEFIIKSLDSPDLQNTIKFTVIKSRNKYLSDNMSDRRYKNSLLLMNKNSRSILMNNPIGGIFYSFKEVLQDKSEANKEIILSIISENDMIYNSFIESYKDYLISFEGR